MFNVPELVNIIKKDFVMYLLKYDWVFVAVIGACIVWLLYVLIKQYHTGGIFPE